MGFWKIRPAARREMDLATSIQAVTDEVVPRLGRTLHRELGTVKTSFNVRREPIIPAPEDAYRCFLRAEMDALVQQSSLLLRRFLSTNRPPGLSCRPPSASRQRAQSSTLRPLPLLEGERKSCAIRSVCFRQSP